MTWSHPSFAPPDLTCPARKSPLAICKCLEYLVSRLGSHRLCTLLGLPTFARWIVSSADYCKLILVVPMHVTSLYLRMALWSQGVPPITGCPQHACPITASFNSFLLVTRQLPLYLIRLQICDFMEFVLLSGMIQYAPPPNYIRQWPSPLSIGWPRRYLIKNVSDPPDGPTIAFNKFVVHGW